METNQKEKWEVEMEQFVEAKDIAGLKKWETEIDRLVEAKDLAGLKKLRDRIFGWKTLTYIRNAIKKVEEQH